MGDFKNLEIKRILGALYMETLATCMKKVVSGIKGVKVKVRLDRRDMVKETQQNWHVSHFQEVWCIYLQLQWVDFSQLSVPLQSQHPL